MNHQLLDIGVIDVETCQPLPNVLVDIWQANSTGFYAGMSSSPVLFHYNSIMQDTLFPVRTLSTKNRKWGANAQVYCLRFRIRCKRRPSCAEHGRPIVMGLHNSPVRLAALIDSTHSFNTLHTAIFPGYYTGRATHIHTKVFPTWKVLPNGTFTSDQLAHVGQFFFEDEINLRIDNVRIDPLLSVQFMVVVILG
jgi:hypothetical protein